MAKAGSVELFIAHPLPPEVAGPVTAKLDGPAGTGHKQGRRSMDRTWWRTVSRECNSSQERELKSISSLGGVFGPEILERRAVCGAARCDYVMPGAGD